MKRAARTSCVLAVIAVLCAAPARADTTSFAVIVGVNAGADAELPALRYADDDAVLYQELFRRLGATTYLLTRPDDNTRRLHAGAAAEAQPPRSAALDRAIAAVAAAAAAARARGNATAVYFVYAGHGNVRDNRSYLVLEDDRLTAADLERRVIDAVPGAQIHLIIDACYSGLLAGVRGPGGERRPLRGFSRSSGLADDARIGLVLSTSSARESHEWEGFQAGVFSHEVRSAMYGAADANGDGQVSYLEVAAFVSRANAAIPNERFRPDIYARSPRGAAVLVDLRNALHRRLEIDGARAGRYALEDDRGVRLLDFHNGAQKVALVRPAATGDLFLRRLDSGVDYRVPGNADVVTFDALVPDVPRAAARGAAHASFSLAFRLAFDEEFVRGFERAHWEAAVTPQARSPSWRRTVSWTAFGVAGGALATGIGFALSARALRDGAAPTDSQARAVERNSEIARRNTGTAICLGAAAAAMVAGAALRLWPEAPPRALPAVQPAAGGAVISIGGAF
jgi:hypothetical protein